MKLYITLFFFLLLVAPLQADDGYRLWLRYDQLQNDALRTAYQVQLGEIYFVSNGEIAKAARTELKLAFGGMLDFDLRFVEDATTAKLVYGILGDRISKTYLTEKETASIQSEGFIIKSKGAQTIIIGHDEKALLYATFRLIQLVQKNKALDNVNILDNPKTQIRILNHWDNLDRTVERGYAGFSIWDWHQLPDFQDPRYVDYARANASIGINGTVVTNVNANALIFREDYLEKAAALADIMRPYGIKLYLTARFSSPMELGGLTTADPLDPEVIKWWQNKVKEIYQKIPDFGGFLVKANSEGQPGPNEYGRSHAEGANMMADALAPYGGIVMWRAFVYSEHDADDRAKQAYNEFVPLDGTFRDNVMIQVKNGPIDFQPREPIHPMFGAMPNTSIMMELQITKEYLGQGTHLVGLANMWEEVLRTDTYAKGKGSTVAQITDGSLFSNKLSGVAGVANIGNDRNWTGNLMGQADWYAFGRLAWDPYLSSETIFEEWVDLSFSLQGESKNTLLFILESSYETCVQYMTPLGLHHIMAVGHHYGPGPWVDYLSRPEWNSAYYHRADSVGLGFDRTAKGSKAIEQYEPDLQKEYGNRANLKMLLWFNHMGWNETLSTGHTLWNELCYQYQAGVDQVDEMREQWLSLKGEVDEERFNSVRMHLDIQYKEAQWWQDACLAYFQSFSGLEIPDGVRKPSHSLQYYKDLKYPHAPGIKPQW